MTKLRKTTEKAGITGPGSVGVRDLEKRLRDERLILAADLPRVGDLAELFRRPDVHDSEDLSVEQADRDVTLHIIDRRSARLALVMAALRRVDEGTYGECVECGGPISSARLNADPAVALCIECQRKLEEGPLRVFEL